MTVRAPCHLLDQSNGPTCLQAYYEPNAHRKNLVVLTQATATRVIFDDSAQPIVATGVEYIVEGVAHTAHASREVILSAGSRSLLSALHSGLLNGILRLLSKPSTSRAFW